MMSFFFFQAEDGIRDVAVTGVQTCALPICRSGNRGRARPYRSRSLALRRSTDPQIGRASCRERVEISVVGVSFKKKKQNKFQVIKDKTNNEYYDDSQLLDLNDI